MLQIILNKPIYLIFNCDEYKAYNLIHLAK